MSAGGLPMKRSVGENESQQSTTYSILVSWSAILVESEARVGVEVQVGGKVRRRSSTAAGGNRYKDCGV
jgi:hypothetical protein